MKSGKMQFKKNLKINKIIILFTFVKYVPKKKNKNENKNYFFKVGFY